MKKIRLAVIGAGSRGTTYANIALEYHKDVEIVAVAEPRDFYREGMANRHTIPAGNVTRDWHDWLAREKFADAIIIATPDALHAAPAIALAELGYHLLLEKPMAPTEAECRKIVEAVNRAGVMLAVCHVMRYTPYTRMLKHVLESGRIGEVVSVQHLEPVGYWHQAHSFVRGNWGNESRSSSMLLQKSCHDLDWLRHVIGKACERVSSFGSLHHFRASQKPAGAAERCLECEVESDCAFSAQRFYLRELEAGNIDWPVNVITSDTTRTGVLEALRTGPYGRCVYSCDNDVVDHQVLNLEFAGGITANFTMTAFTRGRDRETRIFGTKGELFGNGQTLEVFDFLSEKTTIIDTELESDGSIQSGHGGGDEGVMHAFLRALRENNPSAILSGPNESLESHLMVFAAETSRHETRVCQIDSEARA